MADNPIKISQLNPGADLANTAVEVSKGGATFKVPAQLFSIRAKDWVKSKTVTAQPVAPAVYDRYLVPVGATGASWAGQDGKIAEWMLDGSGAGAWFFEAAMRGTIYVEDVAKTFVMVAGTPVAMEDSLGGLLGSIEALNTNGLIARTGAPGAASRSLQSSSSALSITNPDGVAGNPTLALATLLQQLGVLSPSEGDTFVYASGQLRNTVARAVINQRYVNSATTDPLPNTPAVGDTYIVPSTSGSGHANQVARCLVAGTYTYETPQPGVEFLAQDTGARWQYYSGAWVTSKPIFQFNTTAAMLAAFSAGAVLPDGTTCSSVGRDTVGDLGGARYRYVPADTTSADNGSTIRVDGANRRWYLMFNGYGLDIRIGGAKDDAVTAAGTTTGTDNAPVITTMLNVIKTAACPVKALVIPPASKGFCTNSQITWPDVSGLAIVGDAVAAQLINLNAGNGFICISATAVAAITRSMTLRGWSYENGAGVTGDQGVLMRGFAGTIDGFGTPIELGLGFKKAVQIIADDGTLLALEGTVKNCSLRAATGAGHVALTLQAKSDTGFGVTTWHIQNNSLLCTSGIGLLINAAQYCWVQQNIIENNPDIGISVVGASNGQVPGQNVLDNNYFEGCVTANVKFDANAFGNIYKQAYAQESDLAKLVDLNFWNTYEVGIHSMGIDYRQVVPTAGGRNPAATSYPDVLVGTNFYAGDTTTLSGFKSVGRGKRFKYLHTAGQLIKSGDGQISGSTVINLPGALNITVGAGGAIAEYQELVGAVNLVSYLDLASFNAFNGVQTLTDAATINWNARAGRHAVVTLGGNRTLALPTNFVPGYIYCLEVIQDGTGNRTLSYVSNFKFESGTPPVLSTTAGAVDLLFFETKTSTWYLQRIGKAYA